MSKSDGDEGSELLETGTEWKPPFVNPSSLGLFGFGISTIFLMLNYVHIIPMTGAILSNAILFGGIVQVIAGIMEYRRKSTFTMVVYISYGMFWLSLGLLSLLPLLYPAKPLVNPEPLAMGFYVFVWAVYTFFLSIYLFIHLPICHLLHLIFPMLVILFLGLAIVNWVKAGGSTYAAWILEIIVGIEGLLLGLLSFVLATIDFINDSYIGKFQIPTSVNLPFVQKVLSKLKKNAKLVEEEEELDEKIKKRKRKDSLDIEFDDDELLDNEELGETVESTEEEDVEGLELDDEDRLLREVNV